MLQCRDFCLSRIFLLFSLTLCGVLSAAQPGGGQNVPPFDRPIRIAKHIPLGIATPPVALAGETSTWRLKFELAKDIKPDYTLLLLISGSRHSKGVFAPLQADDPAKPGYVTAKLQDGSPITLSEVKMSRAKVFRIGPHEATLAAGTRILMTLGDTSGGAKGPTAPTVRTPNKYFALYCPTLHTSDKNPDKPKLSFDALVAHTMVGACVMHVLGNLTVINRKKLAADKENTGEHSVSDDF